MKKFIASLDKPKLMLIVGLLSFFNGVALLAPGMAFFDGNTSRLFPLALAGIAFYCSISFLHIGIQPETPNER